MNDESEDDHGLEQTTYHEWLQMLQESPFSCGGQGCGLIVSTVGVTGLMAILGLSLFPAGRYPQILLALPGILAGGLYLYLAGYMFFKLPGGAALWVGIIIGVAATAIAVLVLVQ